MNAFFSKLPFFAPSTPEAAQEAKKTLEAKQAQEKIDLETKQKAELEAADKAIAEAQAKAPVAGPEPGPGTASIGGKRSKRTKRNRKSKKGRTGRRSNPL